VSATQASPYVLPSRRRRAFLRYAWLALFLAPAIALLAIFLLYPLFSSFRLSLLDWNGMGQNARFVGLGNWVVLLHDPVFWLAVRNNFLLALFSVLIQLPMGLALAVLLNAAGRSAHTLQVLYFVPLLMSGVAVGVLFKNVYDPNFGPINAVLHAVGLGSLAFDWLGDTHLALAAVIAVVCWQNVPFYMVLFIAGLASFPDQLAEAARLDGAKETTVFWRIKLPHLRGTFRTALLLAVIGSLRYFDLVYVMTGGGPESSSELMATYMYRTVFSSFQLGYGSTIAAAMFLIVVLAAVAAMRATRRYETEI
jgi:raffinose/stachyose/melibiose transport system permease protein